MSPLSTSLLLCCEAKVCQKAGLKSTLGFQANSGMVPSTDNPVLEDSPSFEAVA